MTIEAVVQIGSIYSIQGVERFATVGEEIDVTDWGMRTIERLVKGGYITVKATTAQSVVKPVGVVVKK